MEIKYIIIQQNLTFAKIHESLRHTGFRRSPPEKISTHVSQS